jgi:phosphoribosylformimino-5-aminoimidazole carboxamide ribotide isomerase
MEVIPAIDLLGRQCVRLYQGDFARVTVYSNDPVELARRYRNAGLRRLHVVDLDGARTGSPQNMDLISAMASQAGVAVQAGGGLRDLDRALALRAAGADRVVVGSVAAEQPEVAMEWLDRLGPEHLVLAFDVRVQAGSDPVVLTRGWVKDSGSGLWELLGRFCARGARHFLCTDIAQDGTLAGPNLDLYRECARRFPQAEIIASGGVGSMDHLRQLATTGAASVVTGKALLDGRITLEEIESFSRAA